MIQIIKPEASFAMREGTGASPYVPAIDGMRAIAVIGVLIYHLSIRGINGGFVGSGGFVGVDIFFVISGYLISRIIFTEIDAGRFSFARFYERRIRRIAPAIVATLLGTSLIFLLLLSPAEFGDFKDSLLAAVFSVSNFYFYRTVDYFHNAADIPLLHTWSLAVEEQFYFLFPALIVLWTRRFPRNRLKFLLLLAGLSFISSLYLTNSNQAAAFYFPTSRWWELMAGSILAGINFADEAWDRRKILLSWTGAIGTCLSIVLLNDQMPFPGYRALLPVASACALIIGANFPSFPNAVLTAPPLRWVGKISYSLYLVHWPVISFLACFLQKGGMKFSLLATLISLALAWASWKFIETPFRKGTKQIDRKVFVAYFSSCAVLFLAVSVESVAVRSFWNQYPEAERFQAYFAYDNANMMKTGKCFLTSRTDNLSFYQESECLKLADDKKNILLIGDSHSADLIYAFQAIFPDINFLQASASGCSPVLGTAGAKRCSDLINHIYADWIPAHKLQLDAIVLSARWEGSDIPNLEKTLNWLSANSIKSVVIGPSPEFTVPLPRLLAFSAIAKNDAVVQLFLVKDRLALNQRLKKMSGIAGHYVSISDPLCSTSPPTIRCNVTFNGTPLLFDRDHFTQEGSLHIIDLLSKDFLSRF